MIKSCSCSRCFEHPKCSSVFPLLSLQLLSSVIQSRNAAKIEEPESISFWDEFLRERSYFIFILSPTNSHLFILVTYVLDASFPSDYDRNHQWNGVEYLFSLLSNVSKQVWFIWTKNFQGSNQLTLIQKFSQVIFREVDKRNWSKFRETKICIGTFGVRRIAAMIFFYVTSLVSPLSTGIEAARVGPHRSIDTPTPFNSLVC